jgi:RNA polymerase sigma-32 factor
MDDKGRRDAAVNAWYDSTRERNPLLDEAKRHPLLAPDEERELARRAEAGDSEALRQLVASHLRFVITIARRYRGWGPPMSDLIQEGALGLVRAVRRFDPERGVRLSTYAMWWIRAAIQDHVLQSWSMVRLGSSNAQKMLALGLRRVAEDLTRGEGDPTDDRISRLAQQFNATAADVARLALRMRGRDASLDQGTAVGLPLIDRLASELPTPEQVLARLSEHRYVVEVIKAALAKLTPREQLVIHKRYLDDAKQTFEAIGRELGVSKDRVRQLEARALAKLQELLAPMLADSMVLGPVRANG